MFALLHSRRPTVAVVLAWSSWRSLFKDATKTYMELTNKSDFRRWCFEAGFTSETGSVVADTGLNRPAGFVSSGRNRKEDMVVFRYTLSVMSFVSFLEGNDMEIQAT